MADRTRSLADATVLVDCRWLGATGVGRATELALQALATDPPPGTWVLWGSEAATRFAWPGTRHVRVDDDPHGRFGQVGLRARPPHDVAVYPGQLRPMGRRPSVQYLYDVTAIEAERRMAPRLLRTAYFRMLARADEILTCSPQAADDLARVLHVGRARITVYDFPVDEAAARRAVERRVELGTSATLLFVGRDEPHKNLDRLVLAFARSGWPGRLVLAGPGTESRTDERYRIDGLGRVSDERLTDLFAAARALVLPSLNEGFGLPVLEAQAAGLAVLATDRPPVLGLLDPAVDVALDPEDLDAMTAAISGIDDLVAPGVRTHAGTTMAEHRAMLLAAVERALGG